MLWMKEKDEIEDKPKIWKLILSIALVLILVASIVISYTPLIQFYWINWIVVLIMQNSINLLIFAGLSLVFYITEYKMLVQKANDYDRKLKGGRK